MPIAFNYDYVRMTVEILEDPAGRFGLGNTKTIEQLCGEGEEEECLLEQLKDEMQSSFSVTLEYDNEGRVNKQDYVWILDFEDYVFDDMGRARMPEAAFNADELVIEIPDDIYIKADSLNRM